MVLGCDIGTAVTKAVLLREGKPRLIGKTPTQANPPVAMETMLAELRRTEGVDAADLDEIVVTGWGQDKVPFPHKTRSTIACLAGAAVWSVPSCRTVLCLGAQESVILSVNGNGRPVEYRTSDRCASGAGRFLETIFDALEVRPDESADIATGADRIVAMSSQCAVFAESEVVSLVNDGESVANIVEAVFRALAGNLASLGDKIRMKDTCVVAGGIARNRRGVEILEETLRCSLQPFSPEPDYIAAVGAALSVAGSAR